MLVVVSVLLIGALCSAQEVKPVLTSINVDPVSIDPCNPKPISERPPFTDFDGTLIDQEWWQYIRKASRLPNKFKKANTLATCKSPWSPTADKRRYYWQISCPYKVFWLSRFTRPLYSQEETCYVLFPCMQQVRIVNCTTEYCSTRCRTAHPQVRNSICLENNFQTYRVWVFCTHTHKRRRGKVAPVDCKLNPHLCLKRVTLRVPQCCECWSCWDMYVTMPTMKALPIEGKK